MSPILIAGIITAITKCKHLKANFEYFLFCPYAFLHVFQLCSRCTCIHRLCPRLCILYSWWPSIRLRLQSELVFVFIITHITLHLIYFGWCSTHYSCFRGSLLALQGGLQWHHSHQSCYHIHSTANNAWITQREFRFVCKRFWKDDIIVS
jgi:hypothetical protein